MSSFFSPVGYFCVCRSEMRRRSYRGKAPPTRFRIVWRRNAAFGKKAVRVSSFKSREVAVEEETGIRETISRHAVKRDG
jgi:hypothetical protein